MTIFQQMNDCDGKQINLFTNQFYNIQNGDNHHYLKIKGGNDVVLLGAKSDDSTKNNWYFESTGDNYYHLKS